MAKLKQRNHNEYFQPLAPRQKSCRGCKQKLDPAETEWAWGEYVRAKWRTVKHFCKKCFEAEVKGLLLSHTGDCGCTVTLQARGGHGPLPPWLNLEATCAGEHPSGIRQVPREEPADLQTVP